MCREPRLLCPERPWNGLRQATLLSLLSLVHHQVLAALHNLQLLYRLFCLLQQTQVLAVLHNLQLLYRLFCLLQQTQELAVLHTLPAIQRRAI